MHGYLGFSEAPIQFPEYPLMFPVPQWPRVDDPSFMGIFFSRCKIGQLSGNEEEEYAKKFEVRRKISSKFVFLRIWSSRLKLHSFF